MSDNRLAAFEASLQCTDEVKVVSRETPKVSGVGNWGDLIIDVCHRNRRRHEL